MQVIKNYQTEGAKLQMSKPRRPTYNAGNRVCMARFLHHHPLCYDVSFWHRFKYCCELLYGAEKKSDEIYHPSFIISVFRSVVVPFFTHCFRSRSPDGGKKMASRQLDVQIPTCRRCNAPISIIMVDCCHWN